MDELSSMETFGCGFNGFGQLLPQATKRCLSFPVKIGIFTGGMFGQTLSLSLQLPNYVYARTDDHQEENPSSASCRLKKIVSSWSAIYFLTDTAVFLQGFCNGKKGNFQTVKTSQDVHSSILDVAIGSREKLFYTKINGECIVMDVNTGQDFKVEICDEESESAGPRFLNVSAGDMYTVAVTDESAGLISSENQAYVFRPFDCAMKFSQVSCGKEHVILLSQFHQVYAFGLGSRGQLGHGTTDGETQPRRLEALEGVPMASVSAGGWHSAAISTIGDLYIWGWNESGQLGFPIQRHFHGQVGATSQDRSAKIQEDKLKSRDTTDVSMKRALQEVTKPCQEGRHVSQDSTKKRKTSFSEFNDNAGNMLGESFQCGNMDGLIAGTYDDREGQHTVDEGEISEWQGPSTTSDVHNKDYLLATARMLTCVSSEQTDDLNNPSQDDVADEESDADENRASDAVLFQALPTILDLPDGKDVSKVSCGSRHSAAISVDGYLYTWGWGAHGQLGHGDTQTLDTPTMVKSLMEEWQEKVLDVTCGAWHTLITVTH